MTVVMVTHRRSRLLKTSLRTLAQSVVKCELKIQLRILINGDDQEALQLCEEMKSELVSLKPQWHQLKVSVNPAEARNLIAHKTESEWILFLDDDVQIPEDLFVNFQNLTQKFPQFDIWGGPNLTPPASDYESQLVGWILQNFMVVGPVSSRYKKIGTIQATGGQFNLMLCNLFMKTSVFEKNKFLAHFKTAEENDLIYRLKAQNKKLSYSDELFVWHVRRPTLEGFFKQIFYYGYGRGQLLISGTLASQIIFFLFPFLGLLFFGFLAVAPISALFGFVAWLSIIQASHFVKFRKCDFRVFFAPCVVWILYGLGILKGLSVSLKGTSREVFS